MENLSNMRDGFPEIGSLQNIHPTDSQRVSAQSNYEELEALIQNASESFGDLDDMDIVNLSGKDPEELSAANMKLRQCLEQLTLYSSQIRTLVQNLTNIAINKGPSDPFLADNPTIYQYLLPGKNNFYFFLTY